MANEKLTEKDDFINNVKKYKSNYENLSKNEKCFHKNIKNILDYKNFLKKYDIFDNENGINIGVAKFKIPPKKNMEINIKENDKIIDIINSNEIENNKIYYNLNSFKGEPIIYLNNIIEHTTFSSININRISEEKSKEQEEKFISEYKKIQDDPESNIIIQNPALIFISRNNNNTDFKLEDENIKENKNLKSIDFLLYKLKIFCIKLDSKDNESIKDLLLYTEEEFTGLENLLSKTFNYEKSKFEEDDDEPEGNKFINFKISRF